MKSVVLTCLMGLSLFGCASFANQKSSAVRTRAAFDMACAADKLQVTPLSSEMMERATYGVTGCNKKASYVYTPSIGAVLNSPIETAPMAAADGPKAN